MVLNKFVGMIFNFFSFFLFNSFMVFCNSEIGVVELKVLLNSVIIVNNISVILLVVDNSVVIWVR